MVDDLLDPNPEPWVEVQRGTSPRTFHLTLREGVSEWIPGRVVWRPTPAWADRAAARLAQRMLAKRRRELAAAASRRWTIR